VDWLKRVRSSLDRKKTSTGGERSTAIPDESTQPFDPDEDLMQMMQDTIDMLDSEDPVRSKEADPDIDSNAVLQETEKPTEPDEHRLPPVDAAAEIRVSPDMMSATAILHAPQNGGADITADKIFEELAKQKIVYGLDKPVIIQKVSKRKYEEPFIIASGLAPKDGEDGRVIELVDREKRISFTENAHGDVDFKNLNLINQVEEGTVLCEIIPPTDPVPGRNIYGTEVYGKPGKMPTIPQGDNTVLTDNGTKLIAAKSGNLIYRNNRFSVQILLEIPEDVDNSTGNIEFSGDVLVKGSVFEGYKIVAGGNVTVYGIVEGVYISAGGSIQLKQGINGMGKGVIEAKEDIVCRYLENCTARAGGSISAETIIHSNVYSGGSIIVSGSRSSIIGGICSALQTIEVKTIGSRMNTLTTIMLGATTEMIEERRELALEINRLEKRLYEISLDVKFIQERVASHNLTEKHKELLRKLQKEYPEVTSRLKECKIRAEELEDVISNNLNCRLTCQHIYPPTRINIGTETVNVQEDRNRCIVYYDGEIKFSYS